jgi:hypothetical protein
MLRLLQTLAASLGGRINRCEEVGHEAVLF